MRAATMPIVPIMVGPEPVLPAAAPSTEGITVQMDSVSIDPGTPAQPPTALPVRVTVPLDAPPRSAVAASTIYTQRKLLRRDSMERREALLKGKEGSRQRRRWENGTCRDHRL